MFHRLLSSLRPGPKRPGLGLLGPDAKAPQEQGKSDWGFDKLGLAKASILRADLTDLVVSILNQQSTQSCVSNAWEQALRMERKRLGYPVVLGSRLFGYSNSRAEHFEEKIDSGLAEFPAIIVKCSFQNLDRTTSGRINFCAVNNMDQRKIYVLGILAETGGVKGREDEIIRLLEDHVLRSFKFTGEED